MLDGNILGLGPLCVKVYDPSKKEVIAVYNSIKEASQKLGLGYNVIRSASQTKKRKYCERLGMEIAIRISENNKGAD